MLHIARFDDLKPGAAHGLGHVGGVPQPRRILRPGDVPIGLGSRMADQKEPASLRDPRGQAGHKAGHRELGLVQEGDEHEIHRRARLPSAHISGDPFDPALCRTGRLRGGRLRGGSSFDIRLKGPDIRRNEAGPLSGLADGDLTAFQGGDRETPAS